MTLSHYSKLAIELQEARNAIVRNAIPGADRDSLIVKQALATIDKTIDGLSNLTESIQTDGILDMAKKLETVLELDYTPEFKAELLAGGDS